MTVSLRGNENVDSQSCCNDLPCSRFRRVEIFRGCCLRCFDERPVKAMKLMSLTTLLGLLRKI
jgi:hypothetical protein